MEETKAKEITQSMAEALHAAISEFESLHISSWSSGEEIAKTVISVSSGVVAFTTTFSDSIIKNMQSNYWKYAVCTAWSLFLLAIIAALLSIWNTHIAKSVQVRLLRKNREIRENLSADEPLQKVINSLVDAVTPLNKNIKYAEYSLKTSLILFTVAILILGIIGIGQFICF